MTVVVEAVVVVVVAPRNRLVQSTQTELELCILVELVVVDCVVVVEVVTVVA